MEGGVMKIEKEEGEDFAGEEVNMQVVLFQRRRKMPRQKSALVINLENQINNHNKQNTKLINQNTKLINQNGQLITSINNLIHQQQRAFPTSNFRAISTYNAMNGYEVSFVSGDIIQYCLQADNEYITGKVLRTGKIGFFPAHTVVPI